MFYQNFDDSITNKYGVVIDRWPLEKFCSPSDLKSRNEVNVLFNSWSSGTTFFRRLTSREWEEWKEKRFASAVAPGGGEDSPAQENTSNPEEGMFGYSFVMLTLMF